LLGPRWRWVTLAVLAGCVALGRLGVWQLQRLEARRSLNATLAERAALPPLVLSGATLDQVDVGVGQARLAELYGRAVVVRGVFDHAQEVALSNQVWQDRPGQPGQLGLHLVAPLVIEGSDRAVLVDRGWIPAAPPGPGGWTACRTAGPVEVAGRIRLGQPARGPPSALDGSLAERVVPRLDLERLQGQITHRLLPFVVVQSPAPGEPGRSELPYRKELVVDTGEGVHLIAAIQWFAFAVILAAGYVVYVRRQTPPPRVRPCPPGS
jgi:surfeit locus 1 family protein